MSQDLSTEEIEDRLRVEFIDDARDRLDKLYRMVERVRGKEVRETEAIALIRTEAHNLKGAGTAFGYPTVSLVAHRMEDYFSGLARLEARSLDDAVVFLDRIAELVDRAEQPLLAETSQIIRALPVRYVFDIEDIEIHDVEIMLVTPSKVIAKKVATEMAACGFRPITVQDPIESIGIAVRVPPDMLIASMVMDGLSGIDLIRGLRAMSVTRNVPMALLTSLDKTDSRLKDVPRDVGIIGTGNSFSDDFATVITRFNLG